jgi:tetratricopeptide (TPR) repeat protein
MDSGYLNEIYTILTKDYPQDTMLLAKLYHFKGYYQAAIRAFNEDSIKNLDEAACGRGNAYFALGDFKGAREEFENASKICPDAIYGLAKVNAKLAENNVGYKNYIEFISKAIVYYSNILNVSPNIKIQAEFNQFLDSHSKDAILQAISCSVECDNTQLLNQALDKNTSLGKRFWKQEGLLPCRLEAGTLKKINDLLALDTTTFARDSDKGLSPR